MYNNIWSPLKQEFVKTLSVEGKKALKMYVNSLMIGGSEVTESTIINKSRFKYKLNIRFENIIKSDQDNDDTTYKDQVEDLIEFIGKALNFTNTTYDTLEYRYDRYPVNIIK